jgi:tetratricopeptide (TPR) repeat protein
LRHLVNRSLVVPSDELKTFVLVPCNALMRFLEFTARWDERLALVRDAEVYAVASRDFFNAGWRSHDAGWIHYLRSESAEVFACADRAEAHWRDAQADTRERGTIIRMRGLAYELARDYGRAIHAYREAVKLWRTLSQESKDLVIALSDIASIEYAFGDIDAAERDLSDALRIARIIDYREGIAFATGDLAHLALDRQSWLGAESLARQALLVSQEVGRLELIAADCRRLAVALVRQGKKAEALRYARRSVEICTRLGLPDLSAASEILAECES